MLETLLFPIYIISIIIAVSGVMSTLKYRQMAKVLSVSEESDFAALLLISFVPVFNMVVAFGSIVGLITGIAGKGGTPEGWKR